MIEIYSLVTPDDFPCKITEVTNTLTKVCGVDLFGLTEVLFDIILKMH